MKYIALFLMTLGIFALASQTPAYSQQNELIVGPPEANQIVEKESGSSGPTNLTNPLSVNSVPELIGKVINGILGVVGSLALLMFIYGGFTWMLSGGNASSVERGKNILMWAAIGLVIIFMSYALVSFIIKTTTT